MATDYDAPRKNDDDNESLEALKERSTPEKAAGSHDVDDTDLSGFGVQEVTIPEELEVIVLPPQEDEFTCTACFIVKHRSQMSLRKKNSNICLECDS